MVAYRQSKSKIDIAREKLTCKYYELAKEIISNEFECNLIVNARKKQIEEQKEKERLEKERKEELIKQGSSILRQVGLIDLILSIIGLIWFGSLNQWMWEIPIEVFLVFFICYIILFIPACFIWNFIDKKMH